MMTQREMGDWPPNLLVSEAQEKKKTTKREI